MMQRNINITIRLEGLTPFTIKVPAQEEENAREAQRVVNHLYNSWKPMLGNLSPQDLMGRIAFQLARKFEDVNALGSMVEETMDATEKEFDRILLDME